MLIATERVQKKAPFCEGAALESEEATSQVWRHQLDKALGISTASVRLNLLLFTKGTRWVFGGVEDIGVGFEQRSVPGSKLRKENRARTVAIGLAIFRPG